MKVMNECKFENAWAAVRAPPVEANIHCGSLVRIAQDGAHCTRVLYELILLQSNRGIA